MGTRKLARLRRDLKRARITQEHVAVEAQVSTSHVNHVLHGRAVSAPVVRAAQKLLAERATPECPGPLVVAGQVG